MVLIAFMCKAINQSINNRSCELRLRARPGEAFTMTSAPGLHNPKSDAANSQSPQRTVGVNRLLSFMRQCRISDRVSI